MSPVEDRLGPLASRAIGEPRPQADGSVPLERPRPPVAWLTAPSVRRVHPAARDQWRRRFMTVTDAAAAALAWFLTTTVAVAADATPATYAVPVAAWLIVSMIDGMNDADARRVYSRTADEFERLVLYALIVSLATGLFIDSFSYGDGAVLLVALVATSTVARTIARLVWRRLVAPEKGLIIGDGALAQAIARKLVLEPGHHVGISTAEQYRAALADTDGLAAIEQLEHEIDRVIIAREDLDERLLATIVARCRRADIKLSVAPPIHAALGSAAELTHVAELPLIEFKTWRPPKGTFVAKRVFDLVTSAILLILAAPLFLFIAIALKLTSRGPVLYRSVRAGRGGKPFAMLKFRSMVRDADERLHELVDFDRLEKPTYKKPGDPRITRLGAFLRRTSLDELPQLINVLKGDMSLVGPRPEDIRLVERWDDAARVRLELRPGVTGPMQVHGRASLTFEERLAVDRDYIENYSMSTDLKLLLRTVYAVFSGRGAF